jgi:exo-1,4-beta-D-glucosaminidase
LDVVARAAQRDSQVEVTLEITNPTDHLAFFVNPILTAGPDGDEVLPTYWTDNYFSLVPGETRTVVARVDGFRLAGRTPHVRLEGWNVRAASYPAGPPP